MKEGKQLPWDIFKCGYIKRNIKIPFLDFKNIAALITIS